MSEAQTQIESGSWANLELMGRKVVVGKIAEVVVAGAPMLRIDVPEVARDGRILSPAHTQFYSSGAIYCITPIPESLALAMLQDVPIAPVQYFGPGKIVAKINAGNGLDWDWHIGDDDDGHETDNG